MRKFAVVESVTLDGIMQATGRPDEDTRGGTVTLVLEAIERSLTGCWDTDSLALIALVHACAAAHRVIASVPDEGLGPITAG